MHENLLISLHEFVNNYECKDIRIFGDWISDDVALLKFCENNVFSELIELTAKLLPYVSVFLLLEGSGVRIQFCQARHCIEAPYYVRMPACPSVRSFVTLVCLDRTVKPFHLLIAPSFQFTCARDLG